MRTADWASIIVGAISVLGMVAMYLYNKRLNRIQRERLRREWR